MRRFIQTLVLSVFLLSSFFIHGQEKIYSDGVLSKTIRIKLKPALSSAFSVQRTANGKLASTGLTKVDALNTKYSTEDMRRVFPYSPQYEERHRKHGLHLWYEVTVASDIDPRTIAAAFANLEEIETSETVLEKTLIGGSSILELVRPLNVVPTPPEFFNDPYLPKQWHYNNTGQSGGVAKSDIRLYDAWNITTGTSNIIVSIHDDGLDIKHEDLKDAIFVNQAELNGQPNFDDDGNGYKDDVNGFNFGSNTPNVTASTHGTHVAGTIGAINNNGIGVAGVAGGNGTTKGVRLLPCQILGGTGTSNLPDSYIYAADMGAVISQNSWGYANDGAYEQVVHDAIDYFIAEAGNYPGSPMKGGVVIFAAGNSDSDGLHYPGAYASCISVAALDASFNRAPYSNYGTWVDISAPGGDTGDDALGGGSGSGYSNGILSTLSNNRYGYLDGTSMACPHVSGVAALIVSKFASESFTNTDLKNHLLTGVNKDLFLLDENKDYINKLGAGAIDATLALAIDEKIAPEVINDLVATDIAQDLVNLVWTVPVDQDDEKPLTFEIAYSTEVITPGSLNLAKKIQIRNYKSPGESVEYEINTLQALTKYFVIVRSIDRWGNISGFSNSLEFTTNAGPDASLLLDSIKLNIDVTSNPLGEQSFGLSNSGEGLLKWSAEARHSNSQPLSVSSVVDFSESPVFKQPSGLHALDFSITKPSIQIDNIEDSNNEEYHYIANFYMYKTIGEVDTTFTNSAATRFAVTNNEGFNLTHIDAVINHNESTGPYIVEVYKGNSISDATLLLSQKEFNSASIIPSPSWTTIELRDQLFFEKGDYFWIVYHIPSGNEYPLVASLENEKEDSENSYISLNLGKTWSRFEDQYYDNQLVWSVVAMSNFKSLGTYITLTPNEGQVTSQQEIDILASVDATNMVNGNYSGSIVLYTNETDEPMLRLPVKLNITGHKPAISSTKRLDFNSILFGNSKTLEVEIHNTGLGKFQEPVVKSISPNFIYTGGLKTLLAKGKTKLIIQYKPTTIGSHFGKIVIEDKGGNQHSIELIGTSLDPPVAKINPRENLHDNLSIGDQVSGSFTLKNEGKFPLDYFIPKFDDGSSLPNIPDDIHRFGYQLKIDSSNANPNFQWTDIVATGVNITQDLIGDLKVGIYKKIDLGFEFPFFGKKESSAFISRYGLVSFDTEGVIWSRWPMIYKYFNSPDRFISAWGLTSNFAEAKYGDVYYQLFSDRVIVQYENVPSEDGFFGSLTFQIVLFDNGDIRILYKDVNVEPKTFPWGTIDVKKKFTFVAIEDQTRNDGILIHDQNHPKFTYRDGSTIDFISPGNDLYTSVTNPIGTLLPNESVVVDYTLDTSPLNVAEYLETLVVVTNDPINNPALFSARLNIVAGGEPDVSVSENAFEFGDVFQFDIKKFTFSLKNNGRANDIIQNVSFDNGFFTHTLASPYTIKPGRVENYVLAIKTSTLGMVEDTLRITLNSGRVLKVGLRGNIIDGPRITVTPASLNTILVAGQSKVMNVSVSNPGAYPLSVGFVGNEWVSFNESSEQSSTNVSYQYRTSEQANGPTYEWIEISEGAGTKLEGLDPYAGPQFSEAIDLPFSFDYYGVTYNQLYIGYSGLITFTPNQEKEDKYGFGGPPIPNIEIPNNYIAPLWVGGGTDYAVIYPYTGQYYKIEEDRIIIEYRDYINGFSLGDPVTFQVILYKDGKIKFQYKIDYPENNFTMNYSSIGIENQDGSEGIQISHRTKVVNSNLAILFTPVPVIEIPVGETRTYQVTLDAKDLVAGKYIHQAAVVNNDPLNKGLLFPITLNVTGTPVISVPSALEFGDLMIDNKVITKEFSISNTGTREFYLNSVVNKLPAKVSYDFKSGGIWYPISTLPNLYMVAAKSTIQMRASIEKKAVGNIPDTLIVSATSVGVHKIPVHAAVFIAPHLTLSEKTVEVVAQTNTHQEARTILLGNDGGYPLDYTLEIQFDRETVNANANIASQLSRSSVAIMAIENNSTPSPTTLSTQEDFNRTLAHDSESVPKENLGFGGEVPFFSATSFVAPSNGFNLTHVQTWYSPGSWLVGKIRIKIYSGSPNINIASIIHEQVYEYTIDTPDPNGKLLTIKLDKNIIFYPNEIFFVAFEYDAGATYPQGTVADLPATPDRFFYSEGTSWNDLTDTDYKTYGWFVRALEETFASSAWVELTSPTAGRIDVGLEQGVSLNFQAAFANPGTNKASLHVKSNDPAKPVQVIQLSLKRNRGPVFDMSTLSLSMDENEELIFDVTATDLEGDKYTVVLMNHPAFVSSSFSNGILKVTCTPDFTKQGVYEFKAIGTDALNNISELPIKLTVENVNQSPSAIHEDTVFVSKGEYKMLKLSELFIDNDGDELNATGTSSNTEIFEVFSNAEGFVLNPIELGKAQLVLTVTDSHGAQSTSNLWVVINSVYTGVEENIKGLVTVFPNPTTDKVFVNLPSRNISEVRINLRDATGKHVMQKSLKYSTQFEFDLSSFSQGLYFLQIITHETSETVKILKK